MTNTATFRLFVDDVLVDSDQVSAHSTAEIHDSHSFEQDVVLGSESTIKVVLKLIISEGYGFAVVEFGTWPPSGEDPIVASGKLAHYGIGLVRYSHSGTTLDDNYHQIPFNGSNDEDILGPGTYHDYKFGPTDGRYEWDPYRFDPVEIGEREDVFTRSGDTSVVLDSQGWGNQISYSASAVPSLFDACSWDGTIDLYAYRYQRFTFWYGYGYRTNWPPDEIRWFKSTEYGSNPLLNNPYQSDRFIGWVLDAPELTHDQLSYVDPRDIPDSVYANPGTYLGHKIFAQGQTLSAADSAGGGGLFDFWRLYAKPTYLPVRSRSNPHDIVRASQVHGNKVIRDE